MVRIALCDDNSVQLNIVEDMVRAYADERGRAVEISVYLSGEKLLAAADEGYRADIYILDVIMPGIKGIELGRELRRRGDEGRIIYLTATAEYAVDSYLVGAFFYILKPIGRQKIWDVLDGAFNQIYKERLANRRMGPEGGRVELKVRGGRKSVLIDDILYVDIVNRSPGYHMADGSLELGAMLRGHFSDAVAEVAGLDCMFAATPHLIVNLRCIAKADRNSVTFTNHNVIYPTKGACEAILNEIQ